MKNKTIDAKIIEAAALAGQALASVRQEAHARKNALFILGHGETDQAARSYTYIGLAAYQFADRRELWRASDAVIYAVQNRAAAILARLGYRQA